MAQKPTLDKLIQDLELVKQMAIDDRHITGAISAIVTQAKLLGLDKPQPKPNDDVRLISELMDELSNEPL
ncbi:hypothetical protein RM863_38865, partial [Streptomyces sp. DSM 41014]